jgi:TolB-like protein/tetratricopeptide (TPR) repeat protein
VLLLERPGEIVTREAVRDRLWPADTFVDFDHGLNTAVRKLRQVLGDSADSPRFIETLSRRGYRFVAPVTPAADDGAAAAALPAETGSTAIALHPLPIEPDGRRSRPALFKRRPLIAIAALVLLAVVAWMASIAIRPTPETLDRASIAPSMRVVVLPFRVFPPSEDDKPLGIGLADAVITRLANTRSLHVLPTAAVIKYGDAADPQRAGQELNAAHVVVGMVHRREGGYRITVQLLQTAGGALIWGDTFDVERAKLLGIEESVSVRVAEALNAEFTERARTRRRTPRNPAAYEPYLQARGLLDISSEGRMRAAIESFERALQLDRDFAMARAGLATALAWFSLRYAYANEAREWGRRAEEQAYHALKLDPDLAEAHVAIASAAGTLYGNFNWDRALAAADQALQIEPALDMALGVRARALYHLGLFDTADDAARQAIAINPAATEPKRALNASALFHGRFEEARTQAEAMMKESELVNLRTYLGTAMFYLGEREQAATLLATLKRGNQPDARSQAVLAGVLANMGRGDEARATIARIIDGRYMDHHVAYNLGSAFAQLGQPSEAVKWLGTAINEGFPCYPWFQRDPLLDPIRGDAGFQSLMHDLQQRFATAQSRYEGRGQ